MAAILILDRNIDYQFYFLNKLLEVMKKSEFKVVRKNGIRFLAIFSKLDELQTKKRLLIKIASGVILFDNDVDNLINSLTFLKENLWIIDANFFKQEGFLTKLICLMRFRRHL